MWYFAYGFNLDRKALRDERGIIPTAAMGAVLPGYRLAFNKQAAAGSGKGFANIIPDENGHVEGVVYALTAEDLDNLDRDKGVPLHYRRETVEVILADGRACSAEVYIAQPGMVRAGLLPSRKYLDHLLAGKAYLSAEYFNWLSQQRVLF